MADDSAVKAIVQRTNPCPKCGSTLIHKDCGEPYALIMKLVFPYWQSEDRDDYFYLVRKDDLQRAAQEIAVRATQLARERVLAEAKWWEHLVPDVDHNEPDCIYCKRIKQIEGESHD